VVWPRSQVGRTFIVHTAVVGFVNLKLHSDIGQHIEWADACTTVRTHMQTNTRRLLAESGAALIAGALVLAACGGGSDEADNDPATMEVADSNQADTAEPDAVIPDDTAQESVLVIGGNQVVADALDAASELTLHALEDRECSQTPVGRPFPIEGLTMLPATKPSP
jgi:hypothetical protein